MNTIIGIDFSIMKTGITVLKDNKYYHYIVTKNWKEKDIILYNKYDVEIINRNDKDKNTDIIKNVQDANILAENILDIINRYNDPIICLEGLSYSSRGNVILNLAGYRYIFLSKLLSNGYTNIFNYSPKTIKKIAQENYDTIESKNDMVKAFSLNCKSTFGKGILNNNFNLIKNFKTGCDDIADSYWIIETYKNKKGAK